MPIWFVIPLGTGFTGSCFILTSSSLMHSFFRRRFLFPTRMMYVQKCLISRFLFFWEVLYPTIVIDEEKHQYNISVWVGKWSQLVMTFLPRYVPIKPTPPAFHSLLCQPCGSLGACPWQDYEPASLALGSIMMVTSIFQIAFIVHRVTWHRDRVAVRVYKVQ